MTKTAANSATPVIIRVFMIFPFLSKDCIKFSLKSAKFGANLAICLRRAGKFDRLALNLASMNQTENLTSLKRIYVDLTSLRRVSLPAGRRFSKRINYKIGSKFDDSEPALLSPGTNLANSPNLAPIKQIWCIRTKSLLCGSKFYGFAPNFAFDRNKR